MEQLVDIMQGQIRTLKKDLKEANEAIATHTATATAAAAMAIIPAPASTVAAAAQAPPTAPTRHVNHDYGDKMNRPRLPSRQMDHRPSRCFLCDEEGHVAANCPCTLLPPTPPPTAGVCQPSQPASMTYPETTDRHGRLSSRP